jgi:hypothetical protein
MYAERVGTKDVERETERDKLKKRGDISETHTSQLTKVGLQ